MCGGRGDAECRRLDQHQARGADKVITSSIDTYIAAERGREDDDDGTAGVLVTVG